MTGKVGSPRGDRMNRRPHVRLLAAALAATLGAPHTGSAATPQPQTVKAWTAYVTATESRISRELASPRGFLITDFLGQRSSVRNALEARETAIGELTTTDAHGRALESPHGLISHWRGSILLPGITLGALLERLQHPKEGGPNQEDVVRLRVLDRRPDGLRLHIRLTRSNIVTVTYDTEHVVTYRRLGRTRASSSSIAERIVEIDDAGSASERALAPGDDRGFLWRLNSYWRYEQVPGGVIVELESLTLSRSVPLGFGAVAQPIIDRVARESIGRTLESLRRTHTPTAGVGAAS